MIARYCSWCVPRRLLEEIDDGKPERIETDGICDECRSALEEQHRNFLTEKE